MNKKFSFLLALRSISIFNLLFIVLYFFTNNENYLWVLLFLNFTYLCLYIGNNFVYGIIIFPESRIIEIIYFKYFKKNRVLKSLDDISCSFKKEFETGGLRGEVFRILIKGKTFIKISTNINGWSKEALKEICNYIKDSNN